MKSLSQEVCESLQPTLHLVKSIFKGKTISLCGLDFTKTPWSGRSPETGWVFDVYSDVYYREALKEIHGYNYNRIPCPECFRSK